MTPKTERSLSDSDGILVLRTVHQSQMQLNSMADQKANIIVGAILILLTFIFTRFPALESGNGHMLLVYTALVTLELIALISGIFVIRPRTNWGDNNSKINEMPNPLYFGFFSRFDEKEYVPYLQSRLMGNESAQELLIRDIYQIGRVLKRKYTLLKYSYNFAASGILIASVLYIIQYYL